MTPRIVDGDLPDQNVEVIVNAWNRNLIPWWLLLPQGVSRAIKRRAGNGPFRELGRMGMIPLGGAVETGAGRLPFKAIMHVAGINLLWRSSEWSVRESTRNAVALAKRRGFRSVAFPLIGAGSGGGKADRVLGWMTDELRAIEYDGEVVVVRYRGRPLKYIHLPPVGWYHVGVPSPRCLCSIESPPSWPSCLPRPPSVRTGRPIPIRPAALLGSAKYRAPAPVVNVVMHPNGGAAYLLLNDGRVAVCELSTGKVEVKFRDFLHPTSLAVSPSGRQLLTVSYEAAVIWDTISGKELHRIKYPAKQGERSIFNGGFFAPDGKSLVISRGGILYDYPFEGEPKELAKASIYSTPNLSPDGKLFAFDTRDREPQMTVFDARTLKSVAVIRTSYLAAGSPVRVAFAPDGKTAAAPDGLSKGLTIYDLDTAKPVQELRWAGPRPGGTDQLSGPPIFSADGRTLYGPSITGLIRRWDVAKSEELPPLEGHRTSALLALTPDGRRLVSADRDGVVRVWDAATGKQLSADTGYMGKVYAVASPDARTALLADGGGRIDRWNLANGARLNAIRAATPTPPTQGRPVDPQFGWLPDGRRCYYCDPDVGTVELFEAASGKGQGTLKFGPFVAATPSPDGRSFAVKRDARTLTLLGTDGKSLWERDDLIENGEITAATFSRDGKYLLVGVFQTSGEKPEGTLEVHKLDPATGKFLAKAVPPSRLAASRRPVEPPKFTRDGSRIVIREMSMDQFMVEAPTFESVQGAGRRPSGHHRRQALHPRRG